MLTRAAEITAARMSGLHVGRSGADQRSPARYLVPCGRSRSLPIPPLTVDLIADSTAAMPGSAALWVSIAARNAAASRPAVTPRSAIVALYASDRCLYQGSRYGCSASRRRYASSGRSSTDRPAARLPCVIEL
jgi:hypothetical protein